MIFDFGKKGSNLGTIGQFGKALGTVGLNNAKGMLGKALNSETLKETPIGTVVEKAKSILPQKYGESFFVDSEINDFFKDFDGGESAREAIEMVWGDLDVYFEDLSDTSKKYIQSIWPSIEDGSAKVSDIVKENIDGSTEIINQGMKEAEDTIRSGMEKIKKIGSNLVS